MPRPTPDENREQRRAEIVRAGLALLERGGLARLSLRTLARELGVRAPGLYWYIRSKQELVDLLAKAIVGEALGEVGPARPGETWQAWLTAGAVALRRALVSHRDGARVVAGAYMFQTEAINPALEAALETLEAAGFTREQALAGTITVMRYTMGIALDEQASPPIPPLSEESGLAPEGGPPIDAARWPRLADAMRNYFERMGHDPHDRAYPHFLRGLRFIIGGMERLLERDDG